MLVLLIYRHLVASPWDLMVVRPITAATGSNDMEFPVQSDGSEVVHLVATETSTGGSRLPPSSQELTSVCLMG